MDGLSSDPKACPIAQASKAIQDEWTMVIASKRPLLEIGSSESPFWPL